MQVTAGAGVTIADWQRAARSAGLDTPIDFAARDSATIGGAIATNAGGSRVVRFGTMRQQVVGIEAVLADGTVVGSLAGLPKETAGLHWPSLLAGSEGTLGRDHRRPSAARAPLRSDHHDCCSQRSTASTPRCGVLAAVRRQLGSLDSIEMMFPEAIELVAATSALPRPSTSPPAAWRC